MDDYVSPYWYSKEYKSGQGRLRSIATTFVETKLHGRLRDYIHWFLVKKSADGRAKYPWKHFVMDRDFLAWLLSKNITFTEYMINHRKLNRMFHATKNEIPAWKKNLRLYKKLHTENTDVN